MQRQRGFYLVELVIVIVIVGVLATLAFVINTNNTMRKDRAVKEAAVIGNAFDMREELEALYVGPQLYPESVVGFYGSVSPGDIVPDLEYKVGPFKNPFMDAGEDRDEPSNRKIPGSLIYVAAKDRESYLIYAIGAKGDTILTLVSEHQPEPETPLMQNWP